MVNRTTIEGTVRVLRCGVGEDAYGLEMSRVRGLRRADELRRQPDLEGLAGSLPSPEGDLPVLRLADRLRGTTPDGKRLGHIIVIHAEPGPFGLMVDRVVQAQQVPARCLLPLPPCASDAPTGCFEGVLKLDQELLLLLAPERLCPEAWAGGDGTNPRAARTPGYAASAPPLPRADRRHGQERIVVFSLADPRPRERPLSYALNIALVHEILEPPKLLTVPLAPAFLLGLANWRDWVVPVIDLARRLGLPPTATDKRARLLVVHAPQGAGLLGFLVRPAVQILRLPLPHQPSCRALPMDRTLARGAVEVKNRTLVVPDLSRLLQGGSVL